MTTLDEQRFNDAFDEVCRTNPGASNHAIIEAVIVMADEDEELKDAILRWYRHHKHFAGARAHDRRRLPRR